MEELEHIRCYLLDMDGTFYLGDRLLPGALDFLNLLNANRLEYLFVTNNSSKHARQYGQKLRALGCEVPDERIFTSGEATRIYLHEHHQGKKVHVLGTPALEEEFRGSGIELTEEDADVLVLGFDTGLTYEKLSKFCNLVRQGKPYIATHPDLNCPTENGFIPDTGSFIALIEASTGRRPDVIIGKPFSHIINAITSKTGFPVAQIAMIGDRLYTDIALGNCGITTILVLCGETKREDLLVSKFKPDFVIENLAELTNQLIKQKSG